MNFTRIALRSLRSTVLLPMLVVGLCAALVTIVVEGVLTYSGWHENLRQRAESIANKVNHVVESVSRGSERQRTISAMGADQDITLIAVIGGVPPRIIASTRQAWVGQRLANIPDLQQREDITLALNTRVMQSHELPDSNELSVTIPLLLRDSDHSNIALQNGVAIVHLDTRSTYHKARTAILISSIGFMLIFSLVGIIGYALFRRQVLTPLHVIGRHLSERQTSEGLPASILAGTDEISVVARALDQALTHSEQGEAKLSIIINTALDAVVQMDVAGIITLWNTQAEEIFGWKREEVIGRILYETIIPLQYREAHIRGIKHFLVSGEGPVLNKRIEIFALHRDGHEFPIALSITPLKIAGQYAFSAFISDITELKRIDRMKSEFISTVSHELRTPLTSIFGSLGLIVGGVAGELPEAVKNLVGIAKNNCERLIRLINDLLDSEKIESGKMHLILQVVDIRPLVQQALATNESLADQHRVTVLLRAPDEPLQVRIDSDRLTQVLTNLLSNAVKFSPPEGTVEVRVSRVAQQVRVEVADHGPGIPEEFRSRIFQKFSQADSSDSRQKGGTGLGLNISKALIEQMGGQIGFSSQVGAGSTFFFELPEWKERAILPPPLRVQTAASTPPNPELSYAPTPLPHSLC